MIVRPEYCFIQDLIQDDIFVEDLFYNLVDLLGKFVLAELIFELCSSCLRMSSVPQGAFAANKIRQTMTKCFEHNGGNYSKMNSDKNEKTQYLSGNRKLTESNPLKYNSKMMDSIWGQYNRYSVHNLKKNTDAKQVLLWAEQRLASTTPPAYYISGYNPKSFS